MRFKLNDKTINICNINQSGCNPPNKKSTTAFLDSAASVSCLGKNAIAKLAETQLPAITLNTPSGIPITTTGTLELDLRKLPAKARTAYRVPDIPHNLIAAAELVDAGCGVHLYKHHCEVEYNGETLYRGWRDKASRLWRMLITSKGGNRITPDPDPTDTSPDGLSASKGGTTDIPSLANGVVSNNEFQVAAVYECNNKEQLTKYYHASLGSHPKSTLITAAKRGFLRGCPSFTADAISKFIGIEEATEMGHMRQVQQGKGSTTTKSKRGRPKLNTTITARSASIDDALAIPEQVPDNRKTNLVFMTVTEAEGFISSDQTGKFPRKSNKGNQYICVFYIFDPNFIKGIPIKSRKKEELLRAYEEVYAWCTQRGYKPQLHKMDNETSKDVEDFIASQNTRHQLTPPDMHRTNPAEKALQTYKCCVKSTIASLPPNFPISYWCRLLPQVDLSVNIVRPSRQNPRLSAWATMEGEFHFDATPIAPPGSKMYIHDKPGKRKTFGMNAMPAWYLGPCFKHYRTFRGIVPSTGGERLSDTVRFKHHAIAIPDLTPADRILEATRQLNDAIRQQPRRAPMEEITAIELLREVLLGEQRVHLPPNSVQLRRTNQQIVPPPRIAMTPASASPTATPINNMSDKDNTLPVLIPNYASEDEDDDYEPTLSQRTLRSQRVMQRQRKSTEPNHIAALAASETTCIPDLTVQRRKFTRGYGHANLDLQMKEWALQENFAGVVINEDTGEAMEYRHLIKHPKYKDVWETSLANEFGRLAQGIRKIPGTDTIFFISKSEIPKDRRNGITYGRIVVAYKPNKQEPHRSRLTVGGDRIVCIYDVSTPTADMQTIKLLWNSVLSTPGAKYFTLDISNFYLGTPMERPEYMRMPIKIIPQEIIDKYDLTTIVEDGWVYIKISKGMYGLPMAGKLANDLLRERLKTAGYDPCEFTPGLWKHAWRPMTFTLVVDDFGIKVEGDTHANHLVQTLKRWYNVTVDWKDELYMGIKLEWDYANRTLDTHVPGFVKKALHKYQHPVPAKPQHAPAKSKPIQYGAKIQVEEHDTSPALSPAGIKRIQDVVGTFVWYSRASDRTMTATLSSIASRQSTAT